MMVIVVETAGAVEDIDNVETSARRRDAGMVATIHKCPPVTADEYSR